MRASVTVRVAGSTSNLGAGFDCVGVAIGRWLRVTARAARDAGGRPVAIERGGTLRTLEMAPEADLLYRGFAAACQRAGQEVPAGLALAADSDIPVALVHGLAHADPRLLAAGLDDVLHVPFRRAFVPGYDEVTNAARQAGAYGATLSGSGPTVVAVVAAAGVRAVGDAMVRAWEARG